MEEYISKKTAGSLDSWQGTEKFGPVKLASVDFRDGQQSLIATRMRTEDMLPVLAEMDEFGYDVELIFRKKGPGEAAANRGLY